MINTRINELKEIDRLHIMTTLKSTLKSVVTDSTLDYKYASILAAFVLIKIQQNNKKVINTFDDFCNLYKNNTNAVNLIFNIDTCLTDTDTENSDTWRRIINLKNKFTNDELFSCILFEFVPSDLYDMPSGLVRLIGNMLNLDSNCVIADMSNSNFSFIREMQWQFPKGNYVVNGEQDVTGYNFMLADILKSNISVLTEFVFEDSQYDRVFLKNLYSNDSQKLKNSYPEFCKDTLSWSSEWVNCMVAIKKMKITGKTATVMLNAPTNNKRDTAARKFLVDAGYIESVIALPEKLFGNDWSPTTLFIFSANNKLCKFIDARNICTSGRIKGKKINLLSDDNIAQILDCYSKETNISREVKLIEIVENNYTLTPTRYIQSHTNENAIAFGDAIKSITRGIQFSAKQLDCAISENGIEYMMPSDIKDGIIDDDLVRVIVASKYDKFKAGDNFILLSRIGDAVNNPFRIAVCDRPLLANGNLYIIEINKCKMNPYYIKRFFESPQGLAELSKYSTGDKTPTLSLAELKKVEIPYVSINEQNKIGLSVKENLEDIKTFKQQISKLKKSWLFDIKGGTFMNHEFLFILKKELEARHFALNTESNAVILRKQGKTFTLSDHLQGFIYSLLTNQRKWKDIIPNLNKIDKLFFYYDAEKIKQKNYEYFEEGIRALKCGNISIKAQMKSLPQNIEVFDQISLDYGSVDKFITSAPAYSIVKKMSNPSSKYKLKQMGEALVWEYIRNVGIDGAKPDIHLKRFFGSSRVSASNLEIASDDEVYNIVEQLSIKSDLSKSDIDALIWMYCANGYANVCNSNPDCARCVIKDFCNNGKRFNFT